jgi:aminoglycoside phosphotransferase (APT) family kinase protein
MSTVTGSKLHEDEVHISLAVVKSLVATQLPQWSDLPLTEVRPSGTVNTIYRLGADLAVRLPRVERYVVSLTNELAWLSRLAPQLPIAVPEPVASGKKGSGYPFPWAVYRWLDGEPYADDRVTNETDAAARLAQFVGALRAVDPAGAPRSHRDERITADPFTQSSIDDLPDALDRAAVADAWQHALTAPPWDRAGVWTHGDLIPPNLLVRDGALAAVLDFGGAGVGDPAVDVIPAWSLFGRDGRAAFRAALGVDDETWDRARALALRQAIRLVPYYRETHPEFAAMGARTIARVLDDPMS